MAGLQPFIKRVFHGETVTFERSFYMTALGKRVLRGTFTPDTSEEGQVVGYFVLGLDITAETDIRDVRKLSEARGQSQAPIARCDREYFSRLRAVRFRRPADRQQQQVLQRFPGDRTAYTVRR